MTQKHCVRWFSDFCEKYYYIHLTNLLSYTYSGAKKTTQDNEYTRIYSDIVSSGGLGRHVEECVSCRVYGSRYHDEKMACVLVVRTDGLGNSKGQLRGRKGRVVVSARGSDADYCLLSRSARDFGKLNLGQDWKAGFLT